MRKEIDVTIAAEGRDKGKTFFIQEMDAWAAERWATRAFFAVMNSGAEIDDRLARAGMAGLAMAGIKAFGKLPFEAAEPLLEDLMRCVKLRFQPGEQGIRMLVREDVEEPATILQLRAEVFNLHVNFSPLADLLHSMTPSSARITQAQTSSSTPTSPPPSGPRFHQAKRRTKT